MTTDTEELLARLDVCRAEHDLLKSALQDKGAYPKPQQGQEGHRGGMHETALQLMRLVRAGGDFDKVVDFVWSKEGVSYFERLEQRKARFEAKGKKGKGKGKGHGKGKGKGSAKSHGGGGGGGGWWSSHKWE